MLLTLDTLRRLPLSGSAGLAIALAATIVPVASPAVAQTTTPAAPASAGAIQIVARDQPVGAFLRDLFSRAGRPVVPSPNLTGTVNGVFNGSVDKIYNDIAKAFGLVSYYDGAALYVYSGNEVGVQTISVPQSTALRVQREVRSRGLGNARNTVRVSGDGSLVASGTPRFIEQVSTLARGGPEPQPGIAGAAGAPGYGAGMGGAAPIQPLEFRVFYLRYAHAEDTTVFAGGQQIVVPGLATILQNLVLDQRPGGSAAGNGPQFGSRLIRQSQPRLKGYGLDAVAPNGQQTPLLGLPVGGLYPQGGGSLPNAGDILGGPITSLGDSGGLVAPLSQDIVRIEPSPFLNAIIVRDVPERMAAYDSLIRALDVEPQVVEVDATIIDIDTNKARQLGINWRLTTGGFGSLFGNGNDNSTFVGPSDGDSRLLPTSGSREGNVNNITPSQLGGTISAIIGSNREFLARVTALEQKNVARIIARPQVMTLSNVEAVFDRTRTFYVRVAGREEVDLFNVTAGTIMRVTPHVFRDHDATRIRVMVNIEDGSISTQNVDNIPIVDKASVANQTLVNDGESLLLGGMTIDEDSDIEYKIPLLGDIPVLGNLFKMKLKNKGHIERLFLISPHVVTLGSRVGPTTVTTSQQPALQMTPSASLPLTPGAKIVTPAVPATPTTVPTTAAPPRP